MATVSAQTPTKLTIVKHDYTNAHPIYTLNKIFDTTAHLIGLQPVAIVVFPVFGLGWRWSGVLYYFMWRS